MQDEDDKKTGFEALLAMLTGMQGPLYNFDEMAKKVTRAVSSATESLAMLRDRLYKAPAEPRKSVHRGSNNHNVSEPKVRVKMAKKSNAINRKRIKHWRH